MRLLFFPSNLSAPFPSSRFRLFREIRGKNDPARRQPVDLSVRKVYYLSNVHLIYNSFIHNRFGFDGGTMRIPGTDVSKWQADMTVEPVLHIDWNRLATKHRFVWIKAGQGKWIDPGFEFNSQQAKAVGMDFGYYWFYEYRKEFAPTPEEQAELLLSTMKDIPVMGIALDFEKLKNEALPPRNVCLDLIRRFYLRMDKAGVRSEVFYSNLDFLKNTLGFDYPDWLKKKSLWLAWYPALQDEHKSWRHDLWLAEHLKSEIMPHFMDVKWKIQFWQFTDRLDGLGAGVRSKQLDGNYFFGSEEEYHAWVRKSDLVKKEEGPEETGRAVIAGEQDLNTAGVETSTTSVLLAVDGASHESCTLLISPVFGPAGSQVTVTGARWPASSVIRLGLARSDGSIVSEILVTSSETGSCEAQLKIPDQAASGEVWMIKACIQGAHREMTSISFTVTGSAVDNTYTVQPGDTLGAIALMFKVTLASLLEANPQISNPNLIQPDQSIFLPTGASSDAVHYTVVPGDTLSEIAAAHGTTWQAIFALNRSILSSPNVIIPGQVLRVK
jgi:LysM repeat protein/GH25 family lysozyme M1 (1,4-beta-N-acetylmuramidase)